LVNNLLARHLFLGINAAGSNNFSLKDLQINVKFTTTSNSASIYGVYLNGSTNYQLIRTYITTGNAGSGLTGLSGIPGTKGKDGSGTLFSHFFSQLVDPSAVQGAPGGAGGGGKLLFISKSNRYKGPNPAGYPFSCSNPNGIQPGFVTAFTIGGAGGVRTFYSNGNLLSL
jgi:hypothetical protein